MRLIDVDLLKRRLCVTKCGADHKLCVGKPDSCFQQYRMDMLTLTLDEQPTVDAVEVVRCKDCKHWEDGYFGYCTKIHTAMDYDAFCAYGERRDDG